MCCVRVLFVLLHVCVYGDVHAYFEVHVLLREHLLEMIKLDMTLRHDIMSRDIMCHDIAVSKQFCSTFPQGTAQRHVVQPWNLTWHQEVTDSGSICKKKGFLGQILDKILKIDPPVGNFLVQSQVPGLNDMSLCSSLGESAAKLFGNRNMPSVFVLRVICV